MGEYSQTKKRLDAVSHSFCAAKWLQVSLHLHNGQTHSCHHPASHPIPLELLAQDPSVLHNTPFKIAQRKLMIQGIRPLECSYCWSVEDTPGEHFSDRVLKSSDTWANPEIEKIAALPYSQGVIPRYVEVSFSHACNFKCSYCFPFVSSKIMEEYKKFGPYDISTVKSDPSYKVQDVIMPYDLEEENPYVRAFWEWWPTLYPELKVLRVTGGEPLLSPSTFRVFEKIIESPNKNLTFAINSNLGVPHALIERLITSSREVLKLKSIGKLQIFTSVDSWGAQAEYIRHGLNFSEFWNNLHRINDELPEADITIMTTFGSLSAPGFSKLIDGIAEIKKENRKSLRPGDFSIDVSHLTNPPHLSMLLLPQDYLLKQLNEAQKTMNNSHLFSEHEFNKVNRLVHIVESQKTPINPELRGDFFRFFKEHDRRRGTSFLKNFPELEDFWNQCKKDAILKWMSHG